VDGKPFFGNDPYATLSNLPADIIDKVQVYNEKSEQEQFTGFNEGATTKTINIVTKKDKRHGLFGKAGLGYGGDESDTRYATGGNIHSFDGDRRMSLTLQSNNINLQNFGDQGMQGIPPASGAGNAHINSGGLNYSDKWGKKIDISASYFINSTDNNTDRQTRKQYILSQDSGEVYNEINSAVSTNYSHRMNLRMNYTIDSMNSILFVPQLSLQKSYNNSMRIANTMQADTLLNASNSNTAGDALGYNFNSSLLFRHRFHKKGRTFSANVFTGNNYNNGSSIMQSENIFYSNRSLDDTLNQQSKTLQNTFSVNTNIAYTEPIGKKGMVQVQYTYVNTPGRSERNVYNYSDANSAYSIADTALSNTFKTGNTQNKAGGSYQYSNKKYNFSAGLYYQYATINSTQEQPSYTYISHTYTNLLPVASFQYKVSSTQNIHFNYIASTGMPSVYQLQDVINNNNPLQLSTGNPLLRQPYQHNFTVRYVRTNVERHTSLNTSLSGNITRDQITNNSIIAVHDSIIRQNIILPQGGQLSIPVNINGYWNVRANVSYGLPIALIKCNLNLNINGGLSHNPGIINNQKNYDEKRTAGIGINLNSNISEYVDFIITSNTNISNDVNTLNTNLDNTYINELTALKFNWLTKSGFIFNTEFNYTSNAGNAAGYNQDYTVWNISVGQKLFKKHMGDIRFTIYDVLNENSNIQHTVTESYIADVRSSILQRYYLVTFTYKIRDFKK